MSLRIRTIDFETTGFPEDAVRAICEVGWTDVTVETREISETKSYLVNPGHPIPPQTRGIHHISDSDVAWAPSPDSAMRDLMDGIGDDDLFAAHNCKFEQAFFGGGGRRWICTMQCAKHIWPDAPGYSNQTLRYWLEVDDYFEVGEEARAMPPHRAGPDTFVTAHILARLLPLASIEELVRLTTTPVVLKGPIRFGKHKGTDWQDLPRDYLGWIADKSDMDDEMKYTARHYLKKGR